MYVHICILECIYSIYMYGGEQRRRRGRPFRVRLQRRRPVEIPGGWGDYVYIRTLESIYSIDMCSG